jgi:hypothetical protein
MNNMKIALAQTAARWDVFVIMTFEVIWGSRCALPGWSREVPMFIIGPPIIKVGTTRQVKTAA